jgi:hypothetical protein
MNNFLQHLSRYIPNTILTRLLFIYTAGFQSALFQQPEMDDEKMMKLAGYSKQTAANRLLVDVSHQVYTDQKSGIPRVVKKVSTALLSLDQTFFSFEFVMSLNGELYTARRFSEKILQLNPGSLGVDEKITIKKGDQILILDNSWDKFRSFLPYFEQIHSFNGKIGTVINDIIPTQHPEWLPEDFVSVFLETLPIVVKASDILFCISKTTCEDIRLWIQKNLPDEFNRLRYLTFSQGAEVGTRKKQPASLRKSLQAFLIGAKNESAEIFVQVSVIQPRKGQDYALDTFEKLWKAGENFRLIYVGRKGWKADELYERIISHPEMGTRFLFVENASEDELAAIYDASTALISPSRGEGYGLPVVEAALRGLPVLVSDIPIYHEVAGEGGIFFSLDDSESLCTSVREVAGWTDDERKIKAAKVNIGTWEQGAKEILTGFLN